MKAPVQEGSSKQLFYRIVALWAVCEGMLGGIIHGFHLPGTGLIISSAAVTCISLLAWHFPQRGVILKATIIVCIFKMMLSPHSPPTAYIAVMFQGVAGELVFLNRKYFRVSCLLLAVIALVESAIQRLLVLTIVYGTAVWEAVDIFLSRLSGESTPTSYSWYLAGGYVFLHLIVGIFVGRFIATLPVRLSKTTGWMNDDTRTPELLVSGKRRRRFKPVLLASWVVILLIYLQSEFGIGEPLLPSSLPLQIFIRSVVIILLWYFVVSPLLSAWMKNWLVKKQYRFREEVEAIVVLMPATRQLLSRSWSDTAEEKGLSRLRMFAKLALSRTVH